MAKVTGPFMSIDASGTFADTLTASKWKGINYIRQRVIPTYRNTTLQAAIRSLITDSSQAWKVGGAFGAVTINSAYKLAYNNAASGQAMSGFDLYIKDCVGKNAGSSYDGTFAAPTGPGDKPSRDQKIIKAYIKE